MQDSVFAGADKSAHESTTGAIFDLMKDLRNSHDGKNNPVHDGKDTNAEHVKSGNLPSLTLEDSGKGANKEAEQTHWWSGALAVGEDLARGAWKEATQHPLHLVESAAAGVAIGVAAAVVAPEAAIALGVAGAAVGAYEVATHAGKWIHDAEVVGNQKGHSQAEIDKAHQGLQDVGAGAADIAAGVAGGVAGSYIGSALVTAGARAGAAAALEKAPIAPPVESTPVIPKAIEAPSAAPAPTAVLEAPKGLSPEAMAALPKAKPSFASLLDDEGSTTIPVFTQEQTTMSVGNPAEWAKTVDTNGGGDYGSTILNYANKWATAMESRMAGGEPLSAKMINETGDAADTYGLSGSMYNFAKNALIKSWKFGADMDKILYPPKP